MIHEEDERCLQKYRKLCMQEMHQRLSFGPRFGGVLELDDDAAFLEAVEKEQRLTLVIVHIYEDGIEGCQGLDGCLDCLAAEYPGVKFCRMRASATGARERFSPEVLPTLLVYRAGEMLGNFLCLTKHLKHHFYPTDVENLLNEYGLLPEKEFTACPDEGAGDQLGVE